MCGADWDSLEAGDRHSAHALDVLGANFFFKKKICSEKTPPPPNQQPHLVLPFSSWRFTFYLVAFIAGMAVIVDVSIEPSCRKDLNLFLNLLLSVIPWFLPSNGLVSLVCVCVCGSVAETLVLQPRRSVGRIPYSGKDSFRQELLPKKFAWIFKK